MARARTSWPRDGAAAGLRGVCAWEAGPTISREPVLAGGVLPAQVHQGGHGEDGPFAAERSEGQADGDKQADG